MLHDFDELDNKILAMLQANGRVSYATLGAQLHLSPSACLRRVRRLEDQGVITGYTARIDPGALGLATTVFVEISLTGQQGDLLDAFEDAVARVPEVLSCHLMAGDADYLLQVVAADVADYERIHRTHMARLPGVARLRSSFALRAVGESTPIEFRFRS